ncbi:hypothetical protein RUND412_004676 [Rhizina undulata]
MQRSSESSTFSAKQYPYTQSYIMAHLLLPSGAYLIRNKQTSAIACLETQGGDVTVAEQDLQRRRERQIWWVEALVGYEDDEEGVVYFIYNISDNEQLDSRGWDRFGMDVISYAPNGQPWQKWRIRRVLDDNEGREFYHVLSFYDGGALDIAGIAQIGSHIREFELSENYQQRWEFIVPAVAVPPGWIQIRSAERLFLQQEYITLPPFLGPEIDPLSPLSKRANWGSQWTFLLEYESDEPSQNYWLIKNRLTGGFLGSEKRVHKNGIEITVTAAETYRCDHGCPQYYWIIRKQRDGYWSIVNMGNGMVLENVPVPGGVEIRAERKDFNENNRWKWEFV